MGGILIALDLVCSTQNLDVVPVSTLMGKLIDTGANLGVLVAMPGVTQAGRNLAELYDIIVIEGENVNDTADELVRRIKPIVQKVR